MIIALLMTLLEVHTLDGRMVYINPDEIVSMGPPKDHGLFAEGAHCVISLTDRKFLSVKESCEEVHSRLQVRE